MNTNSVVIIYDSEVGLNLARDAEAAGFAVYEISLIEHSLQEIFNQCSKPLKRYSRRGHREKQINPAYPVIFKNADMIIEYTEESLSNKKLLFRFLDEMCPPKTVFVTNSFSLNVTVIAAETKRPEKVLGLHMSTRGNSVDIIKNVATADETVFSSKAFMQKLNKEVQEFSDYPQELIHYFIMPMINEAAYFLMQGVSNPREIDNLMRIGSNLPIGPLALADLIGLNDCLMILKRLHDITGDYKFYPCPIFNDYIKQNKLGCKTGQGFYAYKDR